MSSPNSIPSNPSFYHHTSYSPPPLPNHTIINGHLLPLQFPFSSQISQPMNHQPSQPICYPQSQPYNSYVCLPTPQFQAQSTKILPTKATTTPPIYQPSPHVPQHELFKPTETNPIDQVTYTQFSYASLQLEEPKVAGSADKSSPHNQCTAESGQNLGVSATPLNMEPCLQMPDHETNGAIEDKSVCGLTPSLAFTTSKGQANIVLEKAFNSIKDGAQGVCENAAEDSEAVNLNLSCKVTSAVLDKSSFWDYLRRNRYKMLVNTNHGNCTKPPDIFHRYYCLHDIAIEGFSKEEFLHVFFALVYACSKLYLFEVRRDFLWNMLEPNFAAMIISYSPLVNVNLGKANLRTGDKIKELKQNIGMMFERMWEHWKSKLKIETSLVDIRDMESDMKLLLHNFEQLIHCCNRTTSVQKDFVLANNSYNIQFHMVSSIIVALTALPLLLLIQKSLSSLDELLYDILFESHYNVLQFDRLAQTAIQNSKLSNVLTQGQAGMRLLVANFVLGLFTWLNGQLRVALASLVHGSLVWKCMKTITHYCSYIIPGIQVSSQMHFLQKVGFWFNDVKSWNVSQGLMEFKGIIVDKDAKSQLNVSLDGRVANYLSLEIYKIVDDHMYFRKFNEQHVTMLKLIKPFFVDNFGKSLSFGVKLEKVIDLLEIVYGLFPFWYCFAPNPSIISASLKTEVHTILHDLALHIHDHELDIGNTTLACQLPLHASEHQWPLLNSTNFLLNTLVLLSMSRVFEENTEVLYEPLRVGQVMSLMFPDHFITNNYMFNVRALLQVHYHLVDHYVGVTDFLQIGFDDNFGSKKDFARHKPIWSLYLQLCHGNLTTVRLAICLNQCDYYLMIMKYKPGMIRMDVELTYERAIKLTTLVQVIVPRAREENAELLLHNVQFFVLGFAAYSLTDLHVLIPVIVAFYSTRVTIMGMLYTIIADAICVFCSLTNGESKSIDISWKSKLKGYSLCLIATQVSATVLLRTRASFQSWTLPSGCCKYGLTLAGVYVDTLQSIFITHAEYNLVVCNNIMANNFCTEDYTNQVGISLTIDGNDIFTKSTEITKLVYDRNDLLHYFLQWGVTLLILYFACISLLSVLGYFWHNSMRIAFDNIMALKVLSIIRSGTFLKTCHTFTRHEDMPYVKGVGLLGLVYLTGYSFMSYRLFLIYGLIGPFVRVHYLGPRSG